MSEETETAAARSLARAIGAADGRIVSVPVGSAVGGMERGGGMPAVVPEERAEADGQVLQPIEMSVLARHVRSEYEENRKYREECGADEYLARMKRTAEGRYSENERLVISAAGAPELFMRVAETKARAGAAMLTDIFNGAEKPWSLEPTPDPDLPDDFKASAFREVMTDALETERVVRMAHELRVKAGLAEPGSEPEGAITPETLKAMLPRKMDEVARLRVEEARARAEAMERVIADQMEEGGFRKEFRRFVTLLSVFGTAVMRGPVPRWRNRVVTETLADGRVRRTMKEEVVLEYDAISPEDCYPSPGARGVKDGSLIVKARFNPWELRELSRIKGRQYKGWNRDAVDAVLENYPQGELREEPVAGEAGPEARRETVWKRTCMIEGLEYYGTARGSELLGIGMRKTTAGKDVVREDYYEIDCIVVDDVVIYCSVIEPEIGRPLYKGEFYETVDSWWADGPMEKCYDAARIVNSTVRNLSVNMAQSSGPMMSVNDVSRLAPGCDLRMRPHKVFQFLPPQFGSAEHGPPIQMFQSDSNSNDLLKVYTFFKNECDDLSGIPAYTYGQGTVASAGRTASGLSMLSEAATRMMKHVIYGISQQVIEPLVTATYTWNVLHYPDETIKGDSRCMPSGIMGQILVEQGYNRMLQFLNLTNNAQDAEIIGLMGRATVLREIAKTLHLNPDKVCGSYERLLEKQRLEDAKAEFALLQQKANMEVTEAGLPGMRQADDGQGMARNAGSEQQAGPPAAPRFPAQRSQPVAEPQQAPGGSVLRAGNQAGGGPQAAGTIRKVITNPRAKAAEASRSASTRMGG